MAGDSKDVELRIRARDYSQKTLSDLVSTLHELVDAQAAQQDAAKRGESTAKELEASYRKLESAAKALISQHALTKTFETQATALEKAKQRTEEARQAQTEYANTLANTEKVTKKQETALAKLGRAVLGAEKAQQQASDRLAATTAKLNQYGIAVDDIAGAQARISAAIETGNAALERQDRALDSVEDNLRAARAAAEAKAQADRLAAETTAAAEKRAAESARAAAIERAQRDKEASAAMAAAVAAAEKQAAADAKAKAAAVAEAKAQDEVRAALNKAADEAIALAKGYDTLASSTNKLTGGNLAKTIRGISDPAGEAIKNLDGIEAAVADVEKRVASANGPIKEYRDTLDTLNATQKSLSNVAGLIDAFRQQEQAVERARIEFQQARTAVRDLATQMRAGNGSTAELGRQMGQAQSRLRAAATEMRNQQQAAQALRGSLEAAGVSTANLAQAEERVIASSNRAKTAVDQLTATYRKYGAEVKQADSAVKLKWFNNGRTTLSWMQRIRGELLAVATAYVGIQAAINLAKGALDAYRSTQAIESRLSIVVGNDAKAIGEEWDYLMGQADRLGFGFEQLAMDYSKFGVSAKAAGMSLQETRYIFERMAEAARGARLSTDDFGGVMRAVEQMLAKGSIQAEELRQQLGDRLPGAFAMAARGAGMAMGEFSKALELGEISSEYVINLAREAGETYGDAFTMGADSMVAAEGRLQTATFKFQKAIAEGGFVDAYSEFLVQLTDLLNSDEGAQLAQLLSDGFTAVIEVLQWCAENTELVKAAFAGFLGLQVASTLASWVPAIAGLASAVSKLFMGASGLRGIFMSAAKGAGTLGGAAGTAAANTTKMAGAIRLLGVAAKGALRFVPYLGAAITAWEVYDALASKAPDAEKAGEEIGKAAAKGFAKGTEDPGTGGTQGDRVAKALMKTLEAEDKRTAKASTGTRMKGAKQELEERLAIVAEPFAAMKKQAEEFITDEKQRAEVLLKIEASLLARQAVEREKYRVEQSSGDDRAAEKRKRIAEEVAMELGRIEDDLRKREVMQDPSRTFDERMKARIDAIAHEYDKLLRKVQQMSRFDPAGAADAKAKVEAYIKQRQEVEAIKVKQEELSRLEKEMNAQTSLRSTMLANLQSQFELGLLSQAEYREQVEETNAVMGEGIAKAGVAVQQFAEAMKELMEPSAYAELMGRIETTVARSSAAFTISSTKLADAETDVNRLLSQRQIIIDDLRQKRQLGLITEREMVDAINDTNSRFKESVTLAAQEVITYANLIRNDANGAAMDALIAKMQGLVLETQNAGVAFTQLHSTIVSSVVNGGVQAFDDMAQSMANVIMGQESVADMFDNMGAAAANFFANFLRDIAKAIIQQQILNMMKSSGNPYIAAAGMAMSASQNHSGAIVGASGSHTRRVDPSWFSGAPRFHSGGLPGLQPNEVPSILEKGEEVLARDDPRNILNGGGGQGGGSARFVLVDDRAKVAEAMAGQEGEQVTLVHLRRNIPTLKQLLR